MTFGSYAYASSGYAGTQVTQVCPPPSCNLIVMNLLEQCLEQSPGYLDLDEISRYVNNII